MAETKFFGARIDPKEFEIIEKVSKEKKVDRTSAIRILIDRGWKGLQLENAMEDYRDGKISLDKAARKAGLTVHEMMNEAAARGITTEEGIEDLRNGIKILLGS